MPAGYQRYRGSRWFVRIAGALFLVAVAVLSGAVIGGVGVYIMNDDMNDDVVSPPPSDAGATANKASAPADSEARQPIGVTSAEDKPVGTADPALPLPSAPTQPAAAAPPQSAPAPQTGAVEPPQQNTAGQDKTSDDANSAGPARAATNGQIARKAALAKKRAAAARMRRSTAEAWHDEQPAAQRPVYDYYRRDDRDHRDSAQPSFGFFGGDRRNYSPDGSRD
jgi:cytoskeletal protein RodZ